MGSSYSVTPGGNGTNGDAQLAKLLFNLATKLVPLVVSIYTLIHVIYGVGYEIGQIKASQQRTADDIAEIRANFMRRGEVMATIDAMKEVQRDVSQTVRDLQAVARSKHGG